MEDLGLVLRRSAACQVSKNRAHQCGRPSGGSSQESSRCGSKYGAHDESRVVSRAMRKGLCIQPTFQGLPPSMTSSDVAKRAVPSQT